MWKKIAIGGAVAAAIVGVGTAALATSGATTSGSPAGPTASTGPGAKVHGPFGRNPGELRRLGKNFEHAQIVTQNPKTKQFVTHDVIRGTVTSIDAGSITVQAADKVTERFTVTSDTVVRRRGGGQHGAGGKIAITDIKNGAHVLVIGTGTSTMTATRVIQLAS